MAVRPGASATSAIGPARKRFEVFWHTICWGSRSTGHIRNTSAPQDDRERDQPEIEYKAYLTVTENYLEHALNQLLRIIPRFLVLQHVAFKWIEFGIVAKVIKEKEVDLIRLVFKDCQDEKEHSAYWWLEPQHLPSPSMEGLIAVTRRLVLDTCTMRNVLGDPLLMRVPMAGVITAMPCSIGIGTRLTYGHLLKHLPIILPRHEFDRSKPLLEHYRSFIKGLAANCPEVSQKVRYDIVQLYNSWKQTSLPAGWRILGVLIKANRENVDVSALQQLDPLTLNELTMEALHRIFCSRPMSSYRSGFLPSA